MYNYNRLNYKNRVQIETFLKEGFSISQIATKIGCHKSTISREIKRGTNMCGTYFADNANFISKQRIQTRYKNPRKKYAKFINYLESNYDKRKFTIKMCVYFFNKQEGNKYSLSFQQVYNLINQDKLNIKKDNMTHKRRKKKLINRYKAKIA
jgi:IS30 family transposase